MVKIQITHIWHHSVYPLLCTACRSEQAGDLPSRAAPPASPPSSHRSAQPNHRQALVRMRETKLDGSHLMLSRDIFPPSFPLSTRFVKAGPLSVSFPGGCFHFCFWMIEFQNDTRRRRIRKSASGINMPV
ncbi:hypothetical protein M404DRAFT_1005954 [Pisolithus tinctorius Marx 270]|uniref:Uncharacterized protein n=1 Tax=Pisolithus tinctorius Marx 270 TaxID=870435 RepID=A0A0C3NQF3_PISTI|nr:hypothetical protein M404DRAFT_1005954 [Pisolithus tinctorius Marx 270]